MGANVEPGIIQRITSGVKWIVTGAGPEAWFGPGQPLAPVAQDKAEGRQFDFPVYRNVNFTPRSNETFSFAQLRGLADGYDLMRLIIEKRKDQIEAFDWEIVPKRLDDNADRFKGAIEDVTGFMQSPDQQHNWQQWLRQVNEELLVIDTVCVYPRENRGGKLYGFELVDGATIHRLLDDTGRTPLPPDPAYQQILKGIPAVDYSRDDLVYMVRNPRVWKIYGTSPVEQVATTVNIALRRQLSQLNFYTEGNVPEALAQVPESWTAKQIADFQLWWDSVMEGNQQARRKMRFMPSLKDIVFPKKEMLKDEYDEWLARIICFAFSISPSALIKQVNRASGEQMADTAKEEGLMPLLRFIEAFMTMLVQKYLKQPDLKFAFKVVNRVDPKSQSDIHKTYVDIEAMTPDEVREQIGLDAMTPQQREEAFPTPVPPGMNADGTPILPKGANGAAVPAADGQPPAAGAPPAKKTEEPSPAEKMLADALSMLDPEKLAKVIADAAKGSAPNVVELRPQVDVNVGDVNVHVPTAREKKAA
jgi:PAS domain-containing protein